MLARVPAASVLVAEVPEAQALIQRVPDGMRLLVRSGPLLPVGTVEGGGAAQVFERPAISGVLTYALPELPLGGWVQGFLNGQEQSLLVSGVNVTLLDYQPGEIESSDQLRFYYFL
jgi:hypothetical protein